MTRSDCGCAVQVSQSAGKRDSELPAVEHLLVDSREKWLAQCKRRLKIDLTRLCTALKACSEQLCAQPADGLTAPGVDPRPRISGTELNKAAHLVRQHRDTLEACAPTAVFSNDDRAAVADALTDLEAVMQQLADRPAAVTSEGLALRTDALQAVLKQLPLPPPSLVSASETGLKDMLVQTAKLVCSHVTLPAPAIQSLLLVLTRVIEDTPYACNCMILWTVNQGTGLLCVVASRADLLVCLVRCSAPCLWLAAARCGRPRRSAPLTSQWSMKPLR